MCVLVTQSSLILCDPMDCGPPPGSSVHGILQTRILEWFAISSSRGSSQPRDWTWVSCIIGRFFTIWATREVRIIINFKINICNGRKLSIVAIFCFCWKVPLFPFLLAMAFLFPQEPYSPWFQPRSGCRGVLSSFSTPKDGHMTYTCPVRALHLLATVG